MVWGAVAAALKSVREQESSGKFRGGGSDIVPRLGSGLVLEWGVGLNIRKHLKLIREPLVYKDLLKDPLYRAVAS